MKLRFIKLGALLVVIPAILSLSIMWLWNAAIPSVFGLSPLNFGQAVCLLLLSHILFGGFGLLLLGGVFHAVSNHMPHPMYEKWVRMTEEQRREFLRKRRGNGFRHIRNKEERNTEETEQ